MDEAERRAFAARQMNRATRLDAVVRRGWLAIALFVAAMLCWGLSHGLSESWLMAPGLVLTIAGFYLLHTMQRDRKAIMRELNDEERRNKGDSRSGDGRRLQRPG